MSHSATTNGKADSAKAYEQEQEWHVEMPRKINVEVEIEIFGTEEHADKVARKMEKMLKLNIPNSKVVAWDVRKILEENSA